MPWKITLEIEILYLESRSGWVMTRLCLHSDRWLLLSGSILSVDGVCLWIRARDNSGLCSTEIFPQICHILAAHHSVAVTWSKTLDLQKPLLPKGPLSNWQQLLKTMILSTVTSNLWCIRKGGVICQHQENSFPCFVLFCFVFLSFLV